MVRMILHRRALLRAGASVLALGIFGGLTLAKPPSGGGSTVGPGEPSTGPGGITIPPASKLPGPWGPIGGPGRIGGGRDDEDDDDDEIAVDCETIGDASDTVYEAGDSMWDGEPLFPGSPAFVGAMMMLVGSLGSILADNDPPRAQYKVDPTFDASRFVPASAPAADLPIYRAAADTLAAVTLTLAHCELHQGAHLAADIPWMDKHRAGFVTNFAAMKAGYRALADALPDYGRRLQESLRAQAGGDGSDAAVAALLKARRKEIVAARKAALKTLRATARAATSERDYIPLMFARVKAEPGVVPGKIEFPNMAARLKTLADRIPDYA